MLLLNLLIIKYKYYIIKLDNKNLLPFYNWVNKTIQHEKLRDSSYRTHMSYINQRNTTSYAVYNCEVTNKKSILMLSTEFYISASTVYFVFSNVQNWVM